MKTYTIFFLLLIFSPLESFGQIIQKSYSIQHKWVSEDDVNVIWEFEEEKVYFNRDSDSFKSIAEDSNAIEGSYILSNRVPLSCGSNISDDPSLQYLEITTNIDGINFRDCYYVFGLNDKYLNIKNTSTGKSWIFKRLD